MSHTRFFVILNERSGTATAQGLTRDIVQERFASAGYEAEVVSDLSQGLPHLVQRAIQSGADAIVAAGGDGTVTGVAAYLADSDKPLLILPLGTANALARDLSIELDFDRWFATLDNLQERRIDMGSVNGNRFLHLVVVGMMPGIAAGREKVRASNSIAAGFKFLGFLARRFGRARRIDVDLRRDRQAVEHHRVSALAIGNNLFDEGLGHLFSRQVLDDGKLSLYLLRRISVLKAVQLGLGMVFGTWRHDDEISIREARQVTVSTRRKMVKVMFDGEPMSLQGPLHFKIEPRALCVLSPSPPPPAGDSAAQ